jgi:hypothetical protein
MVWTTMEHSCKNAYYWPGELARAYYHALLRINVRLLAWKATQRLL